MKLTCPSDHVRSCVLLSVATYAHMYAIMYSLKSAACCMCVVICHVEAVVHCSHVLGQVTAGLHLGGQGALAPPPLVDSCLPPLLHLTMLYTLIIAA